MCWSHLFVYIIGSYVTYIISYGTNVIGTFLLVLSTWMYTLSPPACCYDHSNNATAEITISQQNCSAIATSITLKLTEGSVGSVPPPLSITLAMIGLTVSVL